MSESAEDPHVDFGAVAAETVDESVEHEREITLADELPDPGPEPYDPEVTAAAAEDLSLAEDEGPEEAVDRPASYDDPEPSVADGDQVVNTITAAIRR